MKKLILIFTLLLSSFNVSADLLKDNEFLKQMISNENSREQLAQASVDTYEMFLKFNAQQAIDNPKGSRVSEELMADAKSLAMMDLIQYAIIETFEAAIARDETITIHDEIQQQDIDKGITAAREIMGPLKDNPLFSDDDDALFSSAVYDYLNEYKSDSSRLNGGPYAISIILSLGGINLASRYLYDTDPRTNMEAANRFGRNFLSTFFTNQNAVQSTCPNASCAAPVGGW
mgnify:CR=1 FL=1